jgi:hypothetical protein
LVLCPWSFVLGAWNLIFVSFFSRYFGGSGLVTHRERSAVSGTWFVSDFLVSFGGNGLVARNERSVTPGGQEVRAKRAPGTKDEGRRTKDRVFPT